jgi:hypothetical protein
LGPKSRDFRAHPFKRPEKWISPPSKFKRPAPYKQTTGTLVILWTRDKRETRAFRAHSEMVYNKSMRSLRGRIKGEEGWEDGELEGENKRGGDGGGIGGQE